MSESCKFDEPVPLLTWVPSTVGLRLNYDGVLPAQGAMNMPGGRTTA